jgi:hypothetical protein
MDDDRLPIREAANRVCQNAPERIHTVIRSGWVISALLLAPNIRWLAWPGSATVEITELPRWVTVVRPIELALRMAAFALPFFLTVQLAQPSARPALLVAALALALYYAAWGRYFAAGRSMHLLFDRWMGLPVPLAIAPVMYLLAAAVLTRSAWLAVITCVFGIVHIAVSITLAHHGPGP